MSKEKIYELGLLSDPIGNIPKPDAKKVAESYFGKTPTQPWIDAMDLHEEGKYNDEGVTMYRWRDTSVRIAINDETNEIVDMWEMDEYSK